MMTGTELDGRYLGSPGLLQYTVVELRERAGAELVSPCDEGSSRRTLTRPLSTL
ncbi:MAG: hypothetical protein ABSB68_05745 [Acidimicrobiales bacterium]